MCFLRRVLCRIGWHDYDTFGSWSRCARVHSKLRHERGTYYHMCRAKRVRIERPEGGFRWQD